MEPGPQLPIDDVIFSQLDEAFWEELVNDWKCSTVRKLMDLKV
jgi:hypothetical protein